MRMLLSEIFPPKHGGSGRWFHELYFRLPADQYLLYVGQDPESEAFDREVKHRLLRLPLFSREWGIMSLSGILYYLKMCVRLSLLVRKEKITQIHAGRCMPEGFVATLVSYIFRIPILVYIHGEDIETARLSREHSWMVTQVLRRANLLICNSNNSQKLLTEHWSIKPDKIIVLSPGADVKKFRPVAPCLATKAHLGWEGRKVILTVGRLQKRKGHDMMIRALPNIVKEHPNVLYSIIGNGNEKNSLVQLVEKLNLQSHVQFMDEISDETLLQSYQQSDIFILPNRSIGKDIEGFGMVLIEAQACGIPVIAGDSGGTRETMIPGQTGEIINCTNIKEITDTVLMLLSNDSQLDAYSKAAEKHAASKFSWESHVARAKSIFDSLR